MPIQHRILSIDGGGIRGIIPAMILAEIERRTSRRIASLFDLIAGTSTGGILALGLTKPNAAKEAAYTAQDLVAFYEMEGPTIFSRSVWHRIYAIGTLNEEKYPADAVEEVLNRYFRNVRLSEAMTNVMVTSYELEQRRPYFFKSHRARKNPATRDFLMWEAARATSAAPTYFEPFRLLTAGPLDHLTLIDGGVYANNPAACALAEAICEFKATPQNTFMLSLGTGELTRPIPYEEAKGWGLISWARPILNVAFDGISDSVDYQVNSILNALDAPQKQYYRAQIKLDRGNDDTDDASQTNIWALKLLATNWINSNDEMLDKVCKHLLDGLDT